MKVDIPAALSGDEDHLLNLIWIGLLGLQLLILVGFILLAIGKAVVAWRARRRLKRGFQQGRNLAFPPFQDDPMLFLR